MKCKGLIILLALLSLFFPDPQPAQAATVRLSVAASMTDAFKALAAAFDANHPGITVLPNFGSSGSLAKQIALGAPADLFISANPKWMDYLVREKKVAPATVRIFAYNTLVVVGRQTTPITSLADLLKFDRIAIGSPGSVPAGQYAEQAMRAAGVYKKLLKMDKLVMAKDVRQALIYAARGAPHRRGFPARPPFPAHERPAQPALRLAAHGSGRAPDRARGPDRGPQPGQPPGTQDRQPFRKLY